MQAIWYPSWFGLDLPMEVGQTDTFDFFRAPLESRHAGKLMFSSAMSRGAERVLIRATVLSLTNETLGSIRTIDTCGPYMCTLLDGTNVSVDEEEMPGWICDRVKIRGQLRHVTVGDWTVLVELEQLSEPVVSR